jgi:hypothetical protein
LASNFKRGDRVIVRLTADHSTVPTKENPLVEHPATFVCYHRKDASWCEVTLDRPHAGSPDEKDPGKLTRLHCPVEALEATNAQDTA